MKTNDDSTDMSLFLDDDETQPLIVNGGCLVDSKIVSLSRIQNVNRFPDLISL